MTAGKPLPRILLSVASPLLFAALLLFQTGGMAELKAQRAPETRGKYVGPGSCASTACHGSVKPRGETNVLQNEYSIWVVKDRHSKAYETLSNAVSQRMGRILGAGDPTKAPKCLACHALDVPAADRAKTFELAEGVSCESCHGPASGWLGPHTTRDWTHQKSVELGMVDTKNLLARTQTCLACHLGTPQKAVDHEMIAAGHPALVFELDSFSAVMPPHWKPSTEANAWADGKAWGVGQAAQLRDALKQLARRARTGAWPEYAELQCYSCHHAIGKPEDSWRQERGYAGRRPGNPPWDESRFAVFRFLAGNADAEASVQLATQISAVAQEMSKLAPNREAVANAAEQAATQADLLAQRINGMSFDQQMVSRLAKSITGDADALAFQGEQTAEQVAMALDSLWVAGSRTGRPPANEQERKVREAIQQLFQQLEHPSSYDPFAFARQLKQISTLLP